MTQPGTESRRPQPSPQPTSSAQQSRQPTSRQPSAGRGRRTVLDMVRSLAVIGAMVAAVYLLVPRPQGQLVQPVDVPGAAQVALQAGDVPVVLPELGQDWRATSARRDRPQSGYPAGWHLGYLTPEQDYAGLEVAAAPTPEWIQRVTSDGVQASTQEVSGRSWTVFESVPGGSGQPRTSLLLETDDRVLVVTGTAVLDELVELAEAASAAPVEVP